MKTLVPFFLLIFFKWSLAFSLALGQHVNLNSPGAMAIFSAYVSYKAIDTIKDNSCTFGQLRRGVNKALTRDIVEHLEFSAKVKLVS